MYRVALHQLETPEEWRRLKDVFGLKGDSKGEVLSALLMAEIPARALADSELQELNQIAATVDERQIVAGLDDVYRKIIEISEKPCRDRGPAWTQYVMDLKQKPVSQRLFVIQFAEPLGSTFDAFTRNATTRHATQCLVALRRWQLTHAEPPRDLAEVMSDAGIAAVPRDDYGDGPLKIATVYGQSVIYSVGPDGNDDQALLISDWGQPAGDLVFHIPSQSAAEFNSRNIHVDGETSLEKVLEDYSEAIRLDPRDAFAFVIRGLIWQAKGEADKALADFSEAIRLDPLDVHAFANRASVRHGKGELDRALEDYAEAIRLDPNFAAAYDARGLVWYAKGQYDKAAADHSAAIRFNPHDAGFRFNRGVAWYGKRDLENALKDWDDAIRLNPNYAAAYNNRAYVWATASDPTFRDGTRAVESATRACELTDWKDFNNLGTLAAAYAETGDFDAAVKWQTTLLELQTAQKAAEKELNERRQTLELYKSGKPLRDDQPPGASD